MLISTMNQKDTRILKEMNIKSKAVIINQIVCSQTEIPKSLNTNDIKFLSKREKGLSKSRNNALLAATENICVICDDDMHYVENYEKIIENEYNKKSDSDIIVFHVEGLGKLKLSGEKNINFLTSMKISSVQVTFKRKSILESNIFFNENFGSGSTFIAGEENIFLLECLKRNLKITYVPVTIGSIRQSKSTWFSGYNDEYFVSKGAFFYCASKIFYIPLIFQFAIRKHNIYKKDQSMIKAIKLMLSGRKAYLRILGQK